MISMNSRERRIEPSSSRPLIGVTGPKKGGNAMWWFTKGAVLRAGGNPYRIVPGMKPEELQLDGLILGGGADVSPDLYGALVETLGTHTSEKEGEKLSLRDRLVGPLIMLIRTFSARSNRTLTDSARDALELPLVSQSLESRLPILGICRGEQLLNIFFGGTLHQQLHSFYTESPEIRTVLPRKLLHISPDSLLATILGRKKVQVNSLHRQAVDTLGNGLKAVAWDTNGIIQGIEHTEYPLVLGVQWHPEFLPHRPEQQRLFSRLVGVAHSRKKHDGEVLG